MSAEVSGIGRAGPGVVADERTASLAARGFNKEVEGEYLQNNESLRSTHEAVQRYETASQKARDEMRRFAHEGRLVAWEAR